MKKIYSAFIAILVSFNFAKSQAVLVVEAPLNNNSTSVNRAPNGTSAHAYMRGCFLVLASELSGIPPGTSISSFGYTLNSGTSGLAVSGNYSLYLQSTSDITFQKSTTFATAIVGMTQVYASVLAIPLSAGTTSVMVNLSTPFTYTGGGIYVAYDWYSPGPYSSTAAVYLCESVALPLPGGGGGSNASGASAPSTITPTNFRPAFLFGFTNPYSNDMQVIGIDAPGRVANSFNTPHFISALVKNGSNTTLSNIPVTLTVSGANAFTNQQTIPSLAAGSSTLITFAAFNPQLPGLNSISVTVAGDQNNTNNQASYAQSVTCNEWAKNPATGSYTVNSVGFAAGSGILASTYLNPVSATLTGIRAGVSTNTAAINQQVYAVLLSAAGAVLATTNTITLQNAMLGTFQTFTFSSPPLLAANTSYYLGLAQMTGTVAYYPAGTLASSYMPPGLYAYTGLAGGTMIPLVQNFGYFGIEAIFGHTVTVSAASQTITCASPATINAVSATNYSWSTGATTSSIVVSPTITSAYTVSATNTLGCTGSAVANVSVLPMPLSAAASPTSVFCGNPASLTASSAASTYSWSSGQTAASLVVTPTLSGLFTVTATHSAGCTSSVTVLVAVNPIPVTAMASSTLVCSGTSVTLTAGGASTYSWNTGINNTAQSIVITPTATGQYAVTGFDPSGCSNSAAVVILVQTFTSLVVSSQSATTCAGGVLSFTAGGASAYSWNTGSGTFQGPVFSTTPAASGIYTLTGTNPAGCSMTKTLSITVNTIMVSLNADTAICVGRTLQLNASGANTYTWNNNSQGGSQLVAPVASTKYWVSGTDANGCRGSDTVLVSVNPNPTLSLSPGRKNMCKNESNVIYVSGAGSYSWSTGAQSASIVITPTASGLVNLSVTGYNNSGCASGASVSILVSSCTSLGEAELAAQIMLYPNPTAGLLFIRGASLPGNCTLEVLNILGSRIHTQAITAGETQIDLRKEANGIYIVRMLEDNRVISSHKILKH